MESAVMEPYDYFASLPDEIVLLILDMLSTRELCVIREVCYRFKNLSVDSSLWRYITFNNMNIGVPDLVNSILPTTLEIWITDCDLLKSPTSTSFTTEPLNLRHMSFSGCYIPTELISKCTHLRSIWLCDLDITDEMCGYIALNRSLRNLFIDVSSGFTYSGLLHILKNCLELKYFALWDMRQETPLDDVIDNLPMGLRRLSMCGVQNKLSEVHIQKICKKFRYLEHLSLETEDVYTTSALACIATHLKNLKRLRIFGHVVPLSDLVPLSKLPHLRYLTVHGDGDSKSAVQAILPQVEVVDICRGVWVACPEGELWCQFGEDNARPGELRWKWLQGDEK